MLASGANPSCLQEMPNNFCFPRGQTSQLENFIYAIARRYIALFNELQCRLILANTSDVRANLGVAVPVTNLIRLAVDRESGNPVVG